MFPLKIKLTVTEARSRIFVAGEKQQLLHICVYICVFVRVCARAYLRASDRERAKCEYYLVCLSVCPSIYMEQLGSH